jgi:hypothetical protein
MDGEGGYVGHLFYDFEQYGRMLYGDDSGVTLHCGSLLKKKWLIRSTERVQQLAGFAIFMDALNHYLFAVLQFDPISQWNKVSPTDFEYYFERVYFDMGTRQFNAVEKISKRRV